MQTTTFAYTVRVLAQQHRSGLLDHPSLEVLIAYQSGDLSVQESDNVQEHLSLCSACCQEFLDLQSFLDNSSPARASVPDLEVERAWRRFWSSPGLQPLSGSLTSRPRRALSLGSRWAMQLAAVFSLLVLGLSIQITILSRQVEELSQPIPNVAVRDLIGAVRGPEMPQVIAGDTVLLLHPDGGAFPEYEVEILKGERALCRVRHMRLDQDGNLTLMLPRRFIDPGEYQARLLGLTDLRQVEVGSYRFSVRASGAGSKPLRGRGA